ncbi:hypothetical protein AM493_08215 [Flavobacterium akiainvivens]|uniref:Response regulatory domain-containing protein n=2 Tax=Flavobacterium akiainvivens TaxID=1202724 RepID=A0A0M8MGA1_9FLAO|nr:hypothetical protein AM493_08215 [Flavobacterium akiainvivens]
MFAKNIYLCEDDTDDVEFFQEALNTVDGSFNLTVSCNGFELLDQLKKCTHTLPDLIILDINMPKMNGLETLKAIKKNPAYAAIPVVLYSTCAEEEYIQYAHANGAHYYFVKPYEFGTLKLYIKKLLSINWKSSIITPNFRDFVFIVS